MLFSITEACAMVSAIAATATCIISLANNWQIKIVHRATNSMKDELVKSTRIASEAIGEARGRQLQKDESK
jgi:hypothetical protein